MIFIEADFDLVSICTPPFCHAEIAVDCLNSGKNVIVEKPMAASLEESSMPKSILIGGEVTAIMICGGEVFRKKQAVDVP